MPVIETKDLTHVYLPGTPYEKKALDSVSLSINQGECLGIVGVNGSGKSTLIQHFNGLLSPSSGSVKVNGHDVSDRQYGRELWKEVGLVFQFPEQQLFAGTVFDEIAYGLKNLGLEPSEIKYRVEEALTQVGLHPGKITLQSPLRLSGGIRRGVALACILAMRPSILVLDEPTAGLDAFGCECIIKAVKKMQQDRKTTIIIVSHQINELIILADRIAFLDQGRLAACGDKREVLQSMALHDLEDLILPEYLQLLYRLADSGRRVNTGIITLEEAETEIDKVLKE